ncbi:alpha/beta fold hydrolase [Tautonia marina]|uniref:alpha/beta fold hydrolase n=1 Tax=Tautonia marina TaxID=2653855 RepID=UPI0013755F3A|nr:alpha/beta hydrolase [Tautonia marina]
MPRVVLNETDLHYEDEGSGLALLFVPGLGGTHRMFAPQAVAFRESYRVIRPDLRGNGRSGRLDGPIGTVIDRQCDDLASVLDAVGERSVVMVGVSYGGAVALQFALRHPERLAGLVVVDSFGELRASRPMEGLLLLGSYLTLGMYYLPRPVLKGLAGLFFRRWPTAQAAIPELVDGFRPTEAVLQSIAMCRIDAVRQAGQITCPTLGIVGGATRTAIRLMERAIGPIPGARLEVIPESFDPSNLCQPEAFNRLLSVFLAEIDQT